MAAYQVPITVWPCGKDICSSRAVVEVYDDHGAFVGRFCRRHGDRTVVNLNRSATLAAPGGR